MNSIKFFPSHSLPSNVNWEEHNKSCHLFPKYSEENAIRENQIGVLRNVIRKDIIQEIELLEFKLIISSVLDSLYTPAKRFSKCVHNKALFLCMKN